MKVTFYGFPAWIGALYSPTKCAWWANDPNQLNWDQKALIGVDMSLTPSAARAGQIQANQIQVDDHASNRGRTTIGPLFPGGATIGACWLTDAAWQGIPAQYRPPRVPANASGRDYEYTVVQYFGGEQNDRRFYGFHGRAQQTNGRLTLVDLWHPGTSVANPAPAGQWWLDLGAVTDPTVPALDPAGNREGAIYIEVGTARTIALFEPKLPRLVGTFRL